MGGRLRQRTPDREVWYRWGEAVSDLADRLGWERASLWWWYEQLRALVLFELRLPVEAAEDSAWRLLRGCFDKLEVANETDGWAH